MVHAFLVAPRDKGRGIQYALGRVVVVDLTVKSSSTRFPARNVVVNNGVGSSGGLGRCRTLIKAAMIT